LAALELFEKPLANEDKAENALDGESALDYFLRLADLELSRNQIIQQRGHTPMKLALYDLAYINYQFHLQLDSTICRPHRWRLGSIAYVTLSSVHPQDLNETGHKLLNSVWNVHQLFCIFEERANKFMQAYCQYQGVPCKKWPPLEKEMPFNTSFYLKEMHPLVGLPNLGNTCYINACLQMLYHTSPIRQAIISADLSNTSEIENSMSDHTRYLSPKTLGDTLYVTFSNLAAGLVQLQQLFIQMQNSTSSFPDTQPFIDALGYNHYQQDCAYNCVWSPLIAFYISFIGTDSLINFGALHQPYGCPHHNLIITMCDSR